MWLTRHGRDCGDLYGVLPLAEGLPMMLTEHYDRNPENMLLKGRIGYVTSWVLDPREDSEFEDGARYLRYPPQVVFLQYYEWNKEKKVWQPCRWKIEGIDTPGVYPIRPRTRTWLAASVSEIAASTAALRTAAASKSSSHTSSTVESCSSDGGLPPGAVTRPPPLGWCKS